MRDLRPAAGLHLAGLAPLLRRPPQGRQVRGDSQQQALPRLLQGVRQPAGSIWTYLVSYLVMSCLNAVLFCHILSLSSTVVQSLGWESIKWLC